MTLNTLAVELVEPERAPPDSDTRCPKQWQRLLEVTSVKLCVCVCVQVGR